MSDLKKTLASAGFIADTVVFPVALSRLAEYGIVPVNEKQAEWLRQMVATALANPEIVYEYTEKTAAATDDAGLVQSAYNNMQQIPGLKEAALDVCEFWATLSEVPFRS